MSPGADDEASVETRATQEIENPTRKKYRARNERAHEWVTWPAVAGSGRRLTGPPPGPSRPLRELLFWSGSADRRGRRPSSQPGRNQFAGPMRCMRAGSSRLRMTRASTSTENPSPKPNSSQDPVVAEQERPEDHDHDARRGRDDPAALGLAEDDRQVVAHRAPPGACRRTSDLGEAQAAPLFLHPADGEDLVVHGQPEEHGEHDHREERLDRPGSGQAEDGGYPSPS